MKTLDELKAEEGRLWIIHQEAKKVYDAANNAWNIVYREVQAIEAKKELRAEIMAEIAAKKDATSIKPDVDSRNEWVRRWNDTNPTDQIQTPKDATDGNA